ncbi:MAG TPA: hypothetical protein VGM93_01335 [Acidimicrobiales bacterium]
MTAVLAVTCDGPDCQATIAVEPDDTGGGWYRIEPAEGWLRIQIEAGLSTTHADYCGGECYAAGAVRRILDGGQRG